MDATDFHYYASSSSLITAAERPGYEVFLSFSEEDAARDFAHSLYKSLWNSGITVFEDGEELQMGQAVHSTLLGAIQQSKISIPIITQHYAASKSCLLELMLECKDKMSHIIFPIFYSVNPSDVRHCTGPFEKFSRKRGADGSLKSTLRRIGQLQGHHLQENKSQAELINGVVSLVRRHLKGELFGTTGLVGIDEQVQEIMQLLDVDYYDRQAVQVRSNEVRMVGIVGMGGIGKTTLAKVVYDQLYPLFDGCSFLENIRDASMHKSLAILQTQLVSDLLKQEWPSFGSTAEASYYIKHRFQDMRVLVVLDNVEDGHQLEAFAGELSWYGSRSRIIVTTRSFEVLRVPEVTGAYQVLTHRVPTMAKDQALHLFKKHAFGESQPTEVYESISRDIVSATRGLPLAIEIIGSFLYGKNMQEWNDTLYQIRALPAHSIYEVLKTIYNALGEAAKQIFLDIACFFVGKDKRIAFYMWEDCGFHPDCGTESLLAMSLVRIGENHELLMHDLLRDLGRLVVKDENHLNPGMRSRVWDQEEGLDTLRMKGRNKRVEALFVKFKDGSRNRVTNKELESLSKLRFLKLENGNIRGDCKDLLPNLRWLDWQGCPETLKARNLHLEKLVILDLSWSKVTQEWNGWSQIKMPRLQVLNLTGCTDMQIAPDFSSYPLLEMLILEGCSQLVRLHPSICYLKFLVSLNLKSCQNLCELPEEMGEMGSLRELLIDGTAIDEIPVSIHPNCMKNLEILSASNCISLKGLPDSICRVDSLSILRLDSAPIRELPESIGLLVDLRIFSLHNCHSLRRLPHSVDQLNSLVELDISYTLISELPDSIGNLRQLRVLKMEACHLRRLPSAIGKLRNLEEIHASNCRNLGGSIPRNIQKLQRLKILTMGYSQIESLPSTIQSLSCLQSLDLLKCDNIKTLPMLPSSLARLQVSSKSMSTVPDVQNLTKLEELCLGNENPKEPIVHPLQSMPQSSVENALPLWPIRFPKLKILEFSHSQVRNLEFKYDTICVPQLKKVVLTGANVRKVSGLPQTLSALSIRACLSLRHFPSVRNLVNLSELELLHLPLPEIKDLERLKALETLIVSYCGIVHLNGLSELTSLKRLSLSNCDYLGRLPNLSSLRMLNVLEVQQCKKIDQIEGLEVLTLKKLEVSGCKAEKSSQVKRARKYIRNNSVPREAEMA